MRTTTLMSLFVLPFFVSAQSSTPNVQVITSVISSTGIGSNHEQTTSVFTTTITASATAASSSSQGNSSTTASGNSTASATNSGNSSSTSASTTTPLNLPTAATSGVDGGGDGPGGAPSPGASGQGGIFGPDDGFTAAAIAIQANAALIGTLGMVAGGLLVLT